MGRVVTDVELVIVHCGFSISIRTAKTLLYYGLMVVLYLLYKRSGPRVLHSHTGAFILAPRCLIAYVANIGAGFFKGWNAAILLDIARSGIVGSQGKRYVATVGPQFDPKVLDTTPHILNGVVWVDAKASGCIGHELG